MPLLNITNSLNAYDVVTIENGIATLIDVTTSQSGIIGLVINSQYIAVDEEVLYNTAGFNEGDKLYANESSQLTNVQPVTFFNQMIGYVAKSNVLGKIVLLELGATDNGYNNVLSNNSSTTSLNDTETFTGIWTDVSQYASVVSAVKTDQAGTLYLEFSPDGTNADSSLAFTVSASTNEVHRITITRQYFRARFTNNSGANQSYFRLQSMVGNQEALTSALNSVIQADADAQLVRPLDFNLMTAEGLYQNRNNTIKDGVTTSISTGAVTQDVWTNGSVYTGFPTATSAGEIVVAGADTGTIYYSYMASDTDTDYTFGSKAIAGAGTYTLGHNIYRSNFAYFVATTTTVFNVGLITLRHTATPTNIFWQIPIGYSQTYCAAYTVPFGSSIYLDRINGNVRGSASGTLDGFFWYKPYGESPRLRFPFELQFGGLFFDDIDYLVKIPQRVDIMPRILTSSANNLVGKISYRFIKVRE